jgi:two-component system invasion response regulator UvrY
MTGVLRVLLADDHMIARQGVRDWLLESLGPQHTGEAGSGPEVLRRLADAPWDLLILDLGLPGQHGLDILLQIRQGYPALPILIYSMYPEEAYAPRLFKLGVAGYVSKASEPADLIAAVRKVLAGGRYVSEALGEHLLDRLEGARSSPRHERLTLREFQVFRLLALGRDYEAIAAYLDLTPATVSAYRTRILQKMELATNAQITRYALDHRLIDGGEDTDSLGLQRLIGPTTQ